MSHSATISRPFLVALVAVLAIFNNFEQIAALNGNSVYAPTLTYFFGAKLPADRLCQERVIPKGTATPVLVQYTALTNINFVTVNADRNSKHGFRLSIVAGNTGTPTVGFQLTGKSILPYNVIFQFYCV